MLTTGILVLWAVAAVAALAACVALVVRSRKPPIEIGGDDDDIEALMEAAEAEVGALLDVGEDETPQRRAGLQRQARELVKRRPLGFPAINLAAAAGSVQTLTATAKRGIRINRLLIQVSEAGKVVIDSFKMGDVEQLLTRGVPVELYGANALVDSVPDNFDAVAANTEITIELRVAVAAVNPVTGSVGAKCAVLSTGA